MSEYYTKFAIKNKDGYYYGFHGFKEKKLLFSENIDFYDDEKTPIELMKNRTDIFNDGPYEIVKVSKSVKYGECSKYPDVSKCKFKLEEKLLNVRNHYDCILILLNDSSLNHDVNQISSYIFDQVEKTGMKFDRKEAYKFSELVSNRVYRNEDGTWRPDEELKSESLQMKARRLSEFFATMADTFSLLDKYETWATKELDKKNGSRNEIKNNGSAS